MERNLFSVIVLMGIYSFLMATVLVALDAVDVAMTEASVGAGVSTVLLLGALHLAKGEDAKPIAEEIGYPIAVKAAGGGGGKGFRVALEAGVSVETKEGKLYDNQNFYLCVVRDGKVAEVREYMDTMHTNATFCEG